MNAWKMQDLCKLRWVREFTLKALGQEPNQRDAAKDTTNPNEIIEQMIDGFLQRGHSLQEVSKLFLGIIDDRLKASAEVIITVPERDQGAGEIMVQELKRSITLAP